jgi:ribosomal protein L32
LCVCACVCVCGCVTDTSTFSLTYYYTIPIILGTTCILFPNSQESLKVLPPHFLHRLKHNAGMAVLHTPPRCPLHRVTESYSRARRGGSKAKEVVSTQRGEARRTHTQSVEAIPTQLDSGCGGNVLVHTHTLHDLMVLT